MQDDQNRRAILLALAAVLTLALVAFVAALLIPFDVREPVTITSLTGDAQLLRSTGPAIPLIAADLHDTPLAPDQSLRLEAGKSATLVFELNGGRVQITGPAEFVVRESTRHATLRGHLTASADYTLTIEQRSGTAQYNFANTDPDLESVQTTIRLPGTNYIPESPCFILTVNPDGSADPQPAPCPSP